MYKPVRFYHQRLAPDNEARFIRAPRSFVNLAAAGTLPPQLAPLFTSAGFEKSLRNAGTVGGRRVNLDEISFPVVSSVSRMILPWH